MSHNYVFILKTAVAFLPSLESADLLRLRQKEFFMHTLKR